MRTIQAAIVAFDKPYFIYNANGIKVLPTKVELGSEAIDSLLPGDLFYTNNTIDEVMAEFERLGFEMPEQDVWDFPERPLRLAIPNDDLTEIIKVMPTVIGLLDILKDFIIVRNRTQFIYLEEIYPEDRVKFANYLQERP